MEKNDLRFHKKLLDFRAHLYQIMLHQSLFSEEFGFVGSVFLLILYAVIIYRVIKIGIISRSYFAKLFCYSFGASLFIYIVINMSMVLGLLPIVGSPLPIMSYGGSSMLATMIGFGIVMSAKIHSKQSIA